MIVDSLPARKGEELTALDKRRKRIGVMNSLILISPYKGEALNQFFLVK
ncbi:hypothetical protein QUB60_13345 [Microcoleus sp. A2-C5]|nr:hypothetical protein [Lyngbya sp. CCAP 1446/10]MCW6051673.1 hypothetical protein [Lyngbya sp. CCAP 1446/10]